MKKINKITALVTAASATLLLAPSSVFAEPVSGGISDADINFTTGGTDAGAPTVVDPSDPSSGAAFVPGASAGDPTDDPTEEAGPLTLDYVSSISFGSNEISGEGETYESDTLRPFIQVTDRRGTAEGWSVTAELANFTQTNETTGPTETLNGAVLSFANGEVDTPDSISTPPTAEQPVTLAAGGDADLVINANADEGMGKWLNTWFPTEESETNNSVTLDVPGGAAQTGTHTAEITWTLSDAPGTGSSTPEVPL